MNRLRLHSILMAIVALIVAPLAGGELCAQSKRMALIEEVSNASCLPCALENPVFERFVATPEQAQAAITIVYHGNWPGRDTMNARAPEMNGARVGYYGITGAPRVVVNGAEPKGSSRFWRSGAPADVVALDSAIDVVRETISPVTIRIDQRRRNDSIVATVDVGSMEAVAGRQLRIVLVEREHYYPTPQAGSNGEEHFLYIARAMLPSPLGTPIDIPAGGMQRIVVTAPIDPAWDAEGTYVVAFLQNDTTREVVQAATSRGSAMLASNDPAALRVSDPTPATWKFTATGNDTNRYRVEIESDIPPLWELSVRIEGMPATNGAMIMIAAGDSIDLDATMIPNAMNAGRGRFRVTLRGERGAIAYREGRLYAGRIDLLALRRENSDLSIESLYQPGLRLSPISWAMVEPEDEHLLETDSAEILAFLVGSRALDSADIALLKGYIEGGGRLLIIGSEVAWGLAAPENSEETFPRDQRFLEGILHARYIAGTNSTSAVNGVPGDPVGSGISLRLRDENEMRTTPDRITPIRPARTVLNYGANRTDAAAVRYADDSTRVLFFSVGFEAIADSAVRSDLVERGIRWLLDTDLTLGVPAPAVAERSVGAPAPNPAADRSAIPLLLTSSASVRLRVADMLGRNVVAPRDERLPAGSHMLVIDTGKLPSGIYLVLVDIDGVQVARKLEVR